jgi:hypothetical protein
MFEAMIVKSTCFGKVKGQTKILSAGAGLLIYSSRDQRKKADPALHDKIRPSRVLSTDSRLFVAEQNILF